MEHFKIEKVIEGMYKSLKNSAEIFKDGELLYKNGRYPRAYTSFQFSIEETGKTLELLLLSFSRLSKLEINYNEVCKVFTDHKIKTQTSAVIDYLIRHNIKDEFLKKHIENFFDEYNNPKQYDQLKNASLYVCIKDNSFTLPSEVITMEIAESRRTKALIRLMALSQLIQILRPHLDALAKGFKEYLENNPIEEWITKEAEELRNLTDDLN